MRRETLGGRILVRLLAALAIAGAGIWVGAATHAQASQPPQPGSPQDPLVSQSYVAAALGRMAAHLVRLHGGQAWQPTPGTAWALIDGTATATGPGSGAASVAGPTLVDLTAGSALGTSSPTVVPPDHLLVPAASGLVVTAGSSGAVVWVSASGGGRIVAGPSSTTGG